MLEKYCCEGSEEVKRRAMLREAELERRGRRENTWKAAENS